MAEQARRLAPQRRTQRERHLRVVPDARPRHTLRYALLALVLTGAAVFGAVSLNALAAGDAVHAQELEARVADAERRYEQLVAEVATLESPARIRAAAEELGMVPAQGPTRLQLEHSLPTDRTRPELAADGSATDPLKPVLSMSP